MILGYEPDVKCEMDFASGFVLQYNEEVNRYAVKVLDADGKEVVREISSEKTLEMFAEMLEIEGLLVAEKRYQMVHEFVMNICVCSER